MPKAGLEFVGNRGRQIAHPQADIQLRASASFDHHTPATGIEHDAAKVGDAIVHLTQQSAFPPLILGWLIAMLLSVSTGSATVGIVGAAGLLAPLAGADPSLNLPLLALSIGCGSLFFNYANHAGFWMVKESFGMTMGEATKTISVVQSIVAVVGLIVVLLLNAAIAVS